MLGHEVLAMSGAQVEGIAKPSHNQDRPGPSFVYLRTLTGDDMAVVEQLGDDHQESYESTWQNSWTPGLKTVRGYQNGMINVDKLCFTVPESSIVCLPGLQDITDVRVVGLSYPSAMLGLT